MFEHHEDEFKALLNDINDVSLNKILLNDKLEVYDDERLNKELLVLLYKFYSNKLLSLSYETNIDFKEKVNLIKKIKDNLYELKQGKLTKFNL
jgi:DNA primase